MFINKNQRTTLVKAMVENAEIGRGFKKSNKENIKKFWKGLHETLNSLGPPKKAMCEWKKVWIDQKKHVRKKATLNAKNKNSPDGAKIYIFSALEQAILNLAYEENEKRAEEKIIMTKELSEIDEDTNEYKLFEVGPYIVQEEKSLPERPDDGDDENFDQMQLENSRLAYKQICQSQNDTHTSEVLSIADSFESGQDLSFKQYNELARQLRELKEHIVKLRESQDNLLIETKRHHIEIERLRKIELESNMELIKRQIAVQDWKIHRLKT